MFRVKGLVISGLLGGSGDLVSRSFRHLKVPITPIRIPSGVLISLLVTYLLSPPTLQVGSSAEGLEIAS